MRLVLIFLSLFGCFWATAQRAQISPIISLHSVDGYGIIGNRGDRSYAYVRDGGDVALYAYDNRMREIWKRDLKLLGDRRAISGVFNRAEGITVVYSYLEDKKRYLIVDRFGENAERVDSVYVAKDIERSYGNEFDYELSENEEKLFLYYKERDKILSGYLFDYATDTISWKAAHEYEDLRFSSDLDRVLVSNYGEAFLIFNEDNDRYKLKRHELVLSTIRSNGELLNLNKINIDTLVHVSSAYHWDDRSRQLRTIHFAHNKSNSATRAVSSYLINPYEFDNYEHSYFILPRDLLNEYFRVVDSKRTEIDNLSIQDVIPRADGGFLLIAENFREVFRSNYSVATRDYLSNGGNIDFFYEDVIAMALYPDASLHWSHVLRKKQYSYGDGGAYSSYGLMLTPKRSRLIFNDEIKKENTVSEYVLNGAGILRRFSVMNTQYKDLGLRFRDAEQIGPLSLIVPSEVGNDLQFVKFIFN